MVDIVLKLRMPIEVVIGWCPVVAQVSGEIIRGVVALTRSPQDVFMH
jgi:hypothetical protein